MHSCQVPFVHKHPELFIVFVIIIVIIVVIIIIIIIIIECDKEGAFLPGSIRTQPPCILGPLKEKQSERRKGDEESERKHLGPRGCCMQKRKK